MLLQIVLNYPRVVDDEEEEEEEEEERPRLDPEGNDDDEDELLLLESTAPMFSNCLSIFSLSFEYSVTQMTLLYK